VLACKHIPQVYNDSVGGYDLDQDYDLLAMRVRAMNISAEAKKIQIENPCESGVCSDEELLNFEALAAGAEDVEAYLISIPVTTASMVRRDSDTSLSMYVKLPDGAGEV
jgi:hypothetical protein